MPTEDPVQSTYSIANAGDSSTYEELLRVAPIFAKSLLLVVRQETELGASGRAILDRLRPFELTVRKASHWPGTELIGGGVAELHEFKLVPEVVRVMLEEASGLFDWTQPDRPEDPCLLRSDGSAWLTTIAHEADSYLTLDASDLNDIAREAPSLRNRLVKELAP